MPVTAVLAHAGAPVAPHDVWSAWGFDPVVVAGLALAALLYGRGVRALWRHAGRGQVIAPQRVAAFGAALLALVIALLSPLDALSGTLFAAHMVQHLLLILVAAPLLVLGAPLLAASWALRRLPRRALGRLRGRILRGARRRPALAGAAVLLHAVAVWVWHAPPLYSAAVSNSLVHAAEHSSLLGTAAAFWAVVVAADRRSSGGTAIVATFVIALQSVVLAALLTFAPRVLYPAYAAGAPAWSLTALQDQQVAGGIMWLGGGVGYVTAAAVLFVRWLAADARRADHEQRVSLAATAAGGGRR